MTAPATFEAIPLSPGVKERLFALYHHHRPARPPVVDADAVAAAEQLARLTLPADVRAYLAVLGAIATPSSPDRGPAPGPFDAVLRGEGEIEAFYSSLDPPERRWRRRADFDHVPFEAWGDWPRLYAAIARQPSKRKPFAVFNLKSMSIEAELDSFVAYLDWRWDGAPSPQLPGAYWIRPAAEARIAGTPFDLPSIDLRPRIATAALDAFVPALCQRPQHTVRRVSHKKFGVGVVRREADGKLEVDFGEQGVRTLAAAFLEEVT